MKILVFGAGAIGTIYGYLLSKGGNEVIHYVRSNRALALQEGLHISLLDARSHQKGVAIEDLYDIITITDFETEAHFDLILVSGKHANVLETIQILNENQVLGDIVFLNGMWNTLESLDPFMDRCRYLWGYPVAGGYIDYDARNLEGVVMGNIILNETDGVQTERLTQLEDMFKKIGIVVEKPKQVLHWIWIHMAINAGVISTCLKYGSAEAFMDDSKALREGILTMREALKAVAVRGVHMADFKDETRMFYLPSFLSSHLFRLYFKKNIPSRRIMSLHNNLVDLYKICTDVYTTAKAYRLDTPLLDQKANYFIKKRPFRDTGR